MKSYAQRSRQRCLPVRSQAQAGLPVRSQAQAGLPVRPVRQNFNVFGFTLIELLITVAILAIIGASGFVALTGYRSTQNLDDAAREIAAILREAQSRSISQEQGTSWGVYASNVTSTAPIYALFSGSVVPPPAANISEMYSLPDSVKWNTPASGASDTVWFAPVTGIPSSTNAWIIASRNSATQTRTITVNANGSVSY